MDDNRPVAMTYDECQGEDHLEGEAVHDGPVDPKHIVIIPTNHAFPKHDRSAGGKEHDSL